MQKTITGLLGAVAALGVFGAAQAAPDPGDALKVSSFAELLEPIPDAAARLKAMDEAQSAAPAERNIQLAYHHHHHHHRFWRRFRHHHHHHHHWR
jgi:hypothetical protein